MFLIRTISTAVFLRKLRYGNGFITEAGLGSWGWVTEAVVAFSAGISAAVVLIMISPTPIHLTAVWGSGVTACGKERDFSLFLFIFFCTFVFVKVKRQLAFSCLEPDGEIGVHEHFWDNIHRENEIKTTNYKPSSFCYTANLLVMLCTWTTLRKCRAKALTGLTDLGLEKLGFPVREKKRGEKYERFNVTF